MLSLHEGLVYGPVRSRRLGRSLGVNVLPRQQKVCSFNCSYCQYGWTASPVAAGAAGPGPWPAPASIVKAVSRRLAALRDDGQGVDRLTLAGNGEPTLHPQFPAVVEALVALRDAVAPGLPIAVLSNASTIDAPGVREGLEAADERHMKLDAGEQGLLRRMNAARLPIEQIVSGIAGLRDVVVQAMFVRDRTGRIDNTTDLAVLGWLGRLQEIKPRLVHIYSIDRPVAWPYLQAVPHERLEEIANRVRVAGLEAVAFGGPARALTRAAG